MGFPAVGMEGFYRNPRADVKRFLELKHTKHYKVFNLCIEKSRAYEPEVFDTRVSRYPFQDHQAPPLEMMGQFCSDAHKYLQEDESNVVAVHCKAGKGRAGMMICCYLIHSRMFPNAQEAMIHYAKTRTYDMEGVTIPSQRRYVGYYGDIVNYGFPKQPKIKLSTITVQTSKYVPSVSTTQIFAVVNSRKTGLETVVFKSNPANSNPADDVTINFNDLEVEGDIKVTFFDKSIDKEKEVFHFWFNTGFINNNHLKLTKPEIDKAWNDRKNKKYKPDFEIHADFKGAEKSPMAKLIEKGEKGETASTTKKEKKEKKEKREKKEKKEKKLKKSKSSSSKRETVDSNGSTNSNEKKIADKSSLIVQEESSPKADIKESEEKHKIVDIPVKVEEKPAPAPAPAQSPRSNPSDSSGEVTSSDSGEEIGIPLPTPKDQDYVFQANESNSDNESSSDSSSEDEE